MRSNLVVLFDKIISRKFVSFCYESFNLNAIFCAFCSSKKAANLLVLIVFPEQLYIIILMASLSLALQKLFIDNVFAIGEVPESHILDL